MIVEVEMMVEADAGIYLILLKASLRHSYQVPSSSLTRTSTCVQLLWEKTAQEPIPFYLSLAASSSFALTPNPESSNLQLQKTVHILNAP